MSEHPLSADQRKVYESILDWTKTRHRQSDVLTVGGFAGVGKSFLLSRFAAQTELFVAYACYTGRAASNLARKLKDAGVQTTLHVHPPNRDGSEKEDMEASLPYCSTIHGLIYRPIKDEDSGDRTGWDLRQELDRRYDLLVIDEASMVNEEMEEELRSFGIPILAVGDHGQLEPIEGKSSLLTNPDLRLEKIHRQAESSPIIKLSRVVREEGRLDKTLAERGRLAFYPYDMLDKIVGRACESPLDNTMLAFRNSTRTKINKTARKALRLHGSPKKGEPLIALSNYRPVYNGMRGILAEDAAQPNSLPEWMLRADISFPEEGLPRRTYDICKMQLNREAKGKDSHGRKNSYKFSSKEDLRAAGIKVEKFEDAGKLFDYGYALTVHKAQGSQFPHAIIAMDWILEERPNDPASKIDPRRLTYTAITRASERLSILTNL
jgi:exodeoxyribonuclease V